MGDDIIPKNDAEFGKFTDRLVPAVTGAPDKFGLTAQDATRVKDAQAIWSKAYAMHVKAQQDAQAATQAKNDARGSFESVVRGVVQKINATPGMDNTTRAEAGLPPREEGRTIIGAPKTRPLGRIELRGRSTFVIHFVDEETPIRTAKPQGVQGCQIWSYVGDTPPASPEGYSFLGLDTRTPYTDEHEPEDKGKTAHYLLRWQNAKGEIGPWSEVISAKIPA